MTRPCMTRPCMTHPCAAPSALMLMLTAAPLLTQTKPTPARHAMTHPCVPDRRGLHPAHEGAAMPAGPLYDSSPGLDFAAVSCIPSVLCKRLHTTHLQLQTVPGTQKLLPNPPKKKREKRRKKKKVASQLYTQHSTPPRTVQAV